MFLERIALRRDSLFCFWADPAGLLKERVFDSGSIELEDGNADGFQANFHIFNSTYRVFVLVFPRKSSVSRWTRIIHL